MSTQEAAEDLSDDFVLVDQQELQEVDPVSLEIREKIQEWLYATDYNSDSGDLQKHLKARTPGTCKWLQEQPEFQEWQNHPTNGLLWVEGIPGSGKSVIASALVKDLSKDGTIPVLFFFFRRVIETNQTPRSLLRDWMSQLVRHSAGLARRLESEIVHHPSVTTMPFDILWQIFISSISSLSKAYCIVDALDEMEPGNDYFYAKLDELARLKPAAVKVVATSRRSSASELTFTKDTTTKIKLNRQNIDHDIAVFVQDRFRASEFLGVDEEILKKMKNTICRLSNGLFLYARLTLDELLEKAHLLGKEGTFEPMLAEMPSGIKELYSTLLREQRLRSGVSTERQKLILQWVTHTTRPLRLIELANILNISKGESALLGAQAKAKAEVRQACGPLLEVLIDETVQVIHHSFTEFITDERREDLVAGRESGFPVIKAATTHCMMSVTCLKYLSFGFFLNPLETGDHVEEFRDDDSRFVSSRVSNRETWRERSRQYPFLEYAANNWAVHVRAGQNIDNEQFGALDYLLLQEKRLLQEWLQFYWLPRHQWDEENIPDNFGALHVAAYFGLTQYAVHLLEMGITSGFTETRHFRTPLSFAAEQGHTTTVALLLQHSNPHSHCNRGLTPLDYAAQSGHDATVRLLLESDVRPLSQKTECDHGYFCAFHRKEFKDRQTYRCAIYNGNTQVVRELLKYRGPNDLSGNKNGKTLLHWAAKHGRADIASYLLGTGLICVDAKDRHGHTPLYKAAQDGNAVLVRVLLGYGADSNLRFIPKRKFEKINNEPTTTLLHACVWRQPSISREERSSDAIKGEQVALELLKAGIDVNVRDSVGKTPLHYAARCVWRSEMARLLLRHGADPSIADDGGNHPLHGAASADMVHTLVRAGGDPNARQIDGQTPLLIHLSSGNYDTVGVVRAFIEAGADVDFQNEEGNSALMMCMTRDSEAICSLLLDHGADLHVRNRKSEGILHKLDERNSLMKSALIRKLLEERKSDLDAQDHRGETALFCSARRGDLRKFLTLFDAGANVGIPNYRGRSVLHAAVGTSLGQWPDVNQFHTCRTKVEIVKRILGTGLDPCLVDQEGNTALMELAKADWITSDFALGERENRWRLEAVDILLSAGVSPFAKNRKGKTCLHFASANMDRLTEYQPGPGHLGATKIPLHKFLGLGINVNSTDHEGNTPLHMAASVQRDSGRLAEHHVWKLLDAGADPAMKNMNRMTALHLAAKAGQCSSVAVLVNSMTARSVTLDDRDASGKTSLHHASFAGRLDSVRTLVRAGASLNIKDSKGQTLLHEAVKMSHGQYFGSKDSGIRQVREIINLLVLAGANKHEKDTVGLAPIDLAVVTNSAEALEVFFAASGANNIREWVRGCYEQRDSRFLFLALRAAKKPLVSARAIRSIIQDKTDSSLVDLFCEFVKKGDDKGVDELVGLGCDIFKGPPNEKYSLDCGSPFHLMARWGQDQMMRKVITPETFEKRGEFKQTVLHYAAKSEVNNLDMIKLIVGQGIDVNTRAEHPPDQDFDPSTVVGPTALHYLSSSNYYWQIEAMEYLITVGGDINLRDGFERNCLQLAVNRGGFWKHQVVALLLRNGADINESDGSGLTVLHSATNAGDVEMIDLLIQHGASLNQGSRPPIFAAVNQKNIAVVKLLIEKGASVRVKPTSTMSYGFHTYGSLLEIACSSSYCDIDEYQNVSRILEILLENGADVNEEDDNGYTLVHFLARRNGLLSPIIKAGANIERVDSEGKTPLLAACASDLSKSQFHHGTEYPHTALVLLKAGADASAVDKSGRNALHLLLANTSRHGPTRDESESVIRAMLSSGCSYSATDSQSRTPLHVALRVGKFSAATILIEAGADVHSPDPEGNNALHSAAFFMSRYSLRREYDTIEDPLPFFTRCVATGVDINGPNKAGVPPIFNAVTANFEKDSLQLWLDAGADVTRRNNDGETLLHVVAKGSKDVCRKNCSCICECSDDTGEFEAAKFKLLVQHESCRLDPWIEDNMQRTPLDLAAASGYTEILKIFVEN